MALVTFAEAATHLRLVIVQGASPVDPREADLTAKLLAAEAIVINYLKTYDFPEDARPIVKAAVLLMLGDLWGFRGDDADDKQPMTTGDLSPAVTNLLRRLRDPALA